MLKKLKNIIVAVFIRSNWGVIFIILSSVAILLVSSFLGILWLFLSTVYFLFNKEYKNIFSIWGGFLLSWYLMFTVCMFRFDGLIIIHPDFFETIPKEYCEPGEVPVPDIIRYVIDTFPKQGYVTNRLRNICMETLLLLALISNKLCCSIHVPSLLKGMVHVFVRILRNNPAASCSPEKESRKPSSPKSGPYSPPTSDSSWWRDPEVVSTPSKETIKPIVNGWKSWWKEPKVVPPCSKETINSTVTEANVCREMENSLSRAGQISPFWITWTPTKNGGVFYGKLDGSIINGPAGKVCGFVKTKRG